MARIIEQAVQPSVHSQGADQKMLIREDTGTRLVHNQTSAKAMRRLRPDPQDLFAEGPHQQGLARRPSPGLAVPLRQAQVSRLEGDGFTIVDEDEALYPRCDIRAHNYIGPRAVREDSRAVHRKPLARSWYTEPSLGMVGSFSTDAQAV